MTQPPWISRREAVTLAWCAGLGFAFLVIADEQPDLWPLLLIGAGVVDWLRTRGPWAPVPLVPTIDGWVWAGAGLLVGFVAAALAPQSEQLYWLALAGFVIGGWGVPWLLAQRHRPDPAAGPL